MCRHRCSTVWQRQPRLAVPRPTHSPLLGTIHAQTQIHARVCINMHGCARTHMHTCMCIYVRVPTHSPARPPTCPPMPLPRTSRAACCAASCWRAVSASFAARASASSCSSFSFSALSCSASLATLMRAAHWTCAACTTCTILQTLPRLLRRRSCCRSCLRLLASLELLLQSLFLFLRLFSFPEKMQQSRTLCTRGIHLHSYMQHTGHILTVHLCHAASLPCLHCRHCRRCCNLLVYIRPFCQLLLQLCLLRPQLLNLCCL